MAQKITRTITSTLVNCRTVNAETEEVLSKAFIFAGKINDHAKICKLCAKEAQKHDVAFVKVINVEYIDAKYEMPTETFIANATLVTE